MQIFSEEYWFLIRADLVPTLGEGFYFNQTIADSLESQKLITLSDYYTPQDQNLLKAEITKTGRQFLQHTLQSSWSQLDLAPTVVSYTIDLLKLKLWSFLSGYFGEERGPLSINRKMVSHFYVNWVKMWSQDNTIQAQITDRGSSLVDHCLLHYGDEIIERANNTEPFQKYVVNKIPLATWAIILPKLSADLSKKYAILLRQKHDQ